MMCLNRRTVWLAAALIVVLGTAGLYQIVNANLGPLRFVDVSRITKHDVTSIAIRDGTTGAIVSTSDREQIAEFFAVMAGTTLVRARQTPPSTGWQYYVDLLDGTGSALRVTFKGRIEMDWISSDGSYTVRRGPAYTAADDLIPSLERLFESVGRMAHSGS